VPENVAVLLCDQFTYVSTGFGDEYMNAAYNGMDVHMLVSAGEGFGIPIVEAQAAGCPVIVGDWTAMSELCFSGWKVGKEDARPFWNAAGVFQYYPNPEAVAEKLEMAYRMRGNEDYRKRARDGAVAYDADRVTERYWKPVLAEIEDSLQERVQVERVSKPAPNTNGNLNVQPAVERTTA
jgi:glycosyltransferase involved in cell wall biosynthesis